MKLMMMDCFIGQKNRECRQQIRHTKHHTFVHILNWPDEQPDEFFDSLNSAVQKCFKAYGVETYVDMLGTNEAPGPWYPMYSFSGTMTTSTPGGVAWTKMGEIKHEYLPRVVMADDFESEWNTYMKAYEGCNPQDFLDEMQAELDRRMEEAAKFE